MQIKRITRVPRYAHVVWTDLAQCLSHCQEGQELYSANERSVHMTNARAFIVAVFFAPGLTLAKFAIALVAKMQDPIGAVELANSM